MEESDTDSIFDSPAHPYTQGLLKAIPSISEDMDRLPTIPGNPPSALIHNKGCPFKERCSQYRPECSAVMPQFKSISASQGLACHVTPSNIVTPIVRSA